MIISDVDIKKYIDSDKLIINPFSLDNINPASYDFLLGENLLRPIGDDLIDFRTNLLPEYEELRITEEGYILNPGDFILGQTKERITLPKSLAMFVEGRSYLARVGLEVVQTSTFCEPSHHDSIVTLELKNNGKNPILLFNEMKIAKGIFHTLSSDFSGEFSISTYTSQQEVEPPRV